jgi:hypothetical protein
MTRLYTDHNTRICSNCPNCEASMLCELLFVSSTRPSLQNSVQRHRQSCLGYHNALLASTLLFLASSSALNLSASTTILSISSWEDATLHCKLSTRRRESKKVTRDDSFVTPVDNTSTTVPYTVVNLIRSIQLSTIEARSSAPSALPMRCSANYLV